MANALPIILAAGAAALLLGGKKKKKIRECPEGQVWSEREGGCIPHLGAAPEVTPTPEPTCPPEVDLFNIDLVELGEVSKIIFEQQAGDVIRTADALFRASIPQGCTKKDFKTVLRGPYAKRELVEGYNLSMYYAALVFGVLNRNYDLDDPSDVERGKRIADHIATWYATLTGEPLPDVD